MGWATSRYRRWKPHVLAIVVAVYWSPANVAGAEVSRPAEDTRVAVSLPHVSPCLAGCPVVSSNGNRVVVGENLVFSNNRQTKFPDWVAYIVAPRLFGPTRGRVWRADPRLPENETLEPEDYRGAYAAIGVDRGHLAPLASFAGASQWRVTNYLSNVTPQRSALNRGPWARLEAAVRRLARDLGTRPVHILAGPLYERKMRPLPNADETHVVPSGYWKVVAIGAPDGVGAAIAFVMDQDLPRSADFCDVAYRIGLHDLELRTGIDLFRDLGAPSLAEIQARSAGLAERLGCEERP